MKISSKQKMEVIKLDKRKAKFFNKFFKIGDYIYCISALGILFGLIAITATTQIASKNLEELASLVIFLVWMPAAILAGAWTKSITAALKHEINLLKTEISKIEKEIGNKQGKIINCTPECISGVKRKTEKPSGVIELGFYTVSLIAILALVLTLRQNLSEWFLQTILGLLSLNFIGLTLMRLKSEMEIRDLKKEIGILNRQLAQKWDYIHQTHPWCDE